MAADGQHQHLVRPCLTLLFRKGYVVFGLVVFTILLFLVTQNWWGIKHVIPFATMNQHNNHENKNWNITNHMLQTSDKGSKGLYLPNIKDAGQLSMCDVGVFNNPEDPRFYNIILEDEALAFRPCQDDKLAASLSNSKVVLIGGVKTSYQRGEIIHVRVDLYDGYGNKKNVGGDLIRATIHDMKGYHHAPGVVTDNLDGTYTVEIKAFWSGSSIINITLAYTRELISAVYRVRTQILSTRNVYAKFQSRKYSEETLCHPNRTRLSAATNNSALCDMTHDNSGMPFYCVKPKNVHLLCLDWMLTSAKGPYPVLPLTRCEKMLFERIHKQLRQHVTVDVNEDTACRISPKAPCSKYDITKTWISREPTGYFRGKDWTFVQCGGITKDRIYECLKNKRLYLIGDSTVRHWYMHLLNWMNCTLTTEEWTKETWHKPAECVVKHIGFTAGWYPHSQPFSVGNAWDDKRYTLVSITRYIENIPNDEEAIIVFQLYVHHLAYHHSVVQGRLALIRKTVERFLHRNNKSVVLIKGPHTFSQTPAGERLNDCYSGLYTKILYDTFKGLHDRVVLLNNNDATIAAHTIGNHPPNNIIRAMLEQMFSFACK